MNLERDEAARPGAPSRIVQRLKDAISRHLLAISRVQKMSVCDWKIATISHPKGLYSVEKRFFNCPHWTLVLYLFSHLYFFFFFRFLRIVNPHLKQQNQGATNSCVDKRSKFTFRLWDADNWYSSQNNSTFEDVWRFPMAFVVQLSCLNSRSLSQIGDFHWERFPC